MLAAQQQQRHLASSSSSSSRCSSIGSSRATAAAVRLVPVTRHRSSVQLRAIEEKRDTAGSEASSSPVWQGQQSTLLSPSKRDAMLTLLLLLLLLHWLVTHDRT
jgi:hypothetical protein